MPITSSPVKVADTRLRHETKRISERLRELRLGRKLTISRLAELSKVPASTISKIENDGRCISLRLRCARMARRSCPCVNSRDAVTQRHALLRDAVTQRDVVTSFRFRTVTGLLEARRFDVEILDRLGGLHHDCYFVTRLFAISSSPAASVRRASGAAGARSFRQFGRHFFVR